MHNCQPSIISFGVVFALMGLFLTPAKMLSAQPESITSAARDGNGLYISLGRDRLFVYVCTSDMIEFDYRPNGQYSANTPCISTTTWKPVKTKFVINSDPIILSTPAMTVKISRSPCRVLVYNAAGQLLVTAQDAAGTDPRELDLTGMNGSHYFGIHGWQYLDHAGSQVELPPIATPYTIDAGSEGNTGGPFLWSNKGYAIYVDTVGGKCAIGANDSIDFSDLSRPDVQCYIMVGNAYTTHTLLDELTGMPPMFPKWALGLFNSEDAGITEPIFRRIIDGYRSRGIPFDNYGFDFSWKDWSGNNYGEWRWNAKNFPDGPTGKLKQIADAKGIKMYGIMKPRIHVNTIQGQYATAHGFWVKKSFYKDYFDGGLVGDLDFSIPACRQWYWKHAEGAFNTGIVGWWNDEADAWGDNLAFMYMAESEYEGQRQYTHNQQRVFTLNRNFYSGSQRYAYATWSGDIDSGFAVMQDQRARLLAALNVGQEEWAMDTDGFNNNNHISGIPADECYARWMEFDAFVPIFRLHGTSRRQPWLYGPIAQAAATKAIKLRYSLIPYMYSYEHTLSQKGIGICRPLIWNYPKDPNCLNDVASWMFGKYLLVSPVVKEEQSVKHIYLPAGKWIDDFKGTVYNGGRTISYPVDPTTWQDIPLFIKSGAIIPSIKVMQYIGEKPVHTVSLNIFPSAAKTNFTYYDDDGVTYNYEKGVYFSQKLTVFAEPSKVIFSIAHKKGTYRPSLMNYLCKIHGHKAISVKIDGIALKRYSHRKTLDSTTGQGWSTGKDIYGDVTWIKVKAGVAKKVVLVE